MDNLPTNKNFFDLPEGAESFTLNIDGPTALPFSAPLFWWMNGSNAAKASASQHPALYYGGWVANEQDVQDAAEFYGPHPFKSTPLATRNGKDIAAVASRTLMVAPICYRERWLLNGQDGRTVTYPHYTDGARHQVHMLCLMAFKRQDGTYDPWGPIVLSAKGMQAKNLLNCVSDWRKAIEKTRREVCPAVPAHLFWMLLGTFGKEPNTRMVGKKQQSPINPITVYIPEQITADTLRLLYVGREAVSGMLDWKQQAEAWAEAWKGKAGNGSPADEPEFDQDYVGEPVYTEEIPF